ncbi:VOC family protein [Salinicoccus halitifaciens]|uniref:Glyoxalase family protein n=1 Tax=Salinicoccus halitifaciens TaxID=1073415 RepID=A0ABV2EAR6_9STAP|nr:VOC family protein [Salinicoccus halitifaciens]MCD2137642.1 VOC family protein [Salinicoccus halitifaciens]
MIKGHHHISIYTKNLKENNHFYTKVLGLRGVKVTVNQNDVSMYHIFYGDRLGTSGNSITYFDMPYVADRREGTNAHHALGLLVKNSESFAYWQRRLEHFGHSSEKEEYFGRNVLEFQDPDSLKLVLFSAEGQVLPEEWEPWTNNDVNNDHLILGMGPVQVNVRDKDKLVRMLTEVFKYDVIEDESDYAILHANKGEMTGEIIISEKEGNIEAQGRGTIHHLAIQTEGANLQAVDEILKESGYRTTGVIDRYYFKSLYFREDNGVMFEIVGPAARGFTADVDETELGMQLDLPPNLEEKRTEIESDLMPLSEWT